MPEPCSGDLTIRSPAVRRPGLRRALRNVGLAVVAGICVGCGKPADGAPLDMNRLVPTFDEQFQTLDIDAHGNGRWFTHTPWHGDFGQAAFADPGPNSPFSLSADGLTITATKGPDGRWRSGLISSVNKDGPGQRGFTQQYGYFEMRAKFPDGMGTWPAFWLIGVNKGATSAEIDVVEYYGGFPKYFHSTSHVWSKGPEALSDDHTTEVPEGSLSSGFNDYGVLIEPTTTTYYLNRKAIYARPTPPEYRQPMYILANLALGGGWPIDGLTSPKVMQIRYIKAFQLKPAA